MTTDLLRRRATDQAAHRAPGSVIVVDYALAGDHGECPCQGWGREHVHSFEAHEAETCGDAVRALVTANPFARVLGIREVAR